MKRLLATFLLILCLSFPSRAGHVMGMGAYCPCDGTTHGLTMESVSEEETHDASIDLGLILIAVLLYLDIRA